MTRFNKRPSGLLVPSPIVSTPSATARTGNNARGYVRDAKSELFLLAVSNFVGQETFYEAAGKRDDRFAALIHQVAGEDAAWLSRFLPWLRSEANMRTAAIVGAVEFCRAFKAQNSLTRHHMGYARATMAAVLQRADEPGEALAYHLANYGRKLPKSLKRGVADAAQRLYNEFNTLKYDTASHGVRFGDVLELTHAKPGAPYQTTLFKHLIDRRHGREGLPEGLAMIERNAWVRANVSSGNMKVLLDGEVLRAAGMTWEDVLSLAGSQLDKLLLWQAMIPSMGYMALLRNLRNFDQAGISDAVAGQVIQRLINPEQVARSRQLPLRFLSAFNAVSNLRWAYPLEQALELSLQNVPEFKGSTLILIDTSGSMNSSFSKDGSLRYWDAAALFGLALARRCENATVVSFSSHSREFPLTKGASLLTLLTQFRNSFFFNGGTATAAAVREHYHNHDRVVVLTDEQADAGWGNRGVFDPVPQNKMCLTFNLAGYRVGHAESGSGTRVTIGGLTDQAFKLMPILEQRAAGQWPF